MQGDGFLVCMYVLGRKSLLHADVLARNIEIAFFVFSGLCLMGTIPSTARRK